ncbi:hypothetical protein M2360_004169 [Rhizobium sp. SG_E_25_P2]|nr:hypothetical protein [Rhizobium sp. SG_E_25_P2]
MGLIAMSDRDLLRIEITSNMAADQGSSISRFRVTERGVP